MPLFDPDIVAPRDPAGFGRWLIGHYLEHRAFIERGAINVPPVIIPDFDILPWSDEPRAVRFWLDAHAQIHNALRAPLGITGIDLSAVDFSDDEDFEIWLQDHASEHALLRPLYGLS